MKIKIIVVSCFILLFVGQPMVNALSPAKYKALLTWDISTLDTKAGHYISLALDSGDNPRISYYDHTNGDLKYARWTGSTWSIQTVDSAGDVGSYTSLALDSGNNPHISYYDKLNSDLKHARWTGSTWNIETVDSTGKVGAGTSIALNSGVNPRISYYDITNGDLKYARWTGSAWSTHTIDSAGDVGRYSSLALDSGDNPHISYYDKSNSDLKYVRWTGSAWSIQTVDSAGVTGPSNSIALDSGDDPHISYIDITNGEVKYARWTGSAWNIGTVDHVGDVPWYTSIALDSGDNPHISYYDMTVDDLKYARWTGSGWSKETVDSAGSVGGFNSIALDSGDNPHISYRDFTGDALKYARAGEDTGWDYNAQLNPGGDIIRFNIVDGTWIHGISEGLSWTVPVLGKYEDGYAWIAVDLPAGGEEMSLFYINTATMDGYQYGIWGNLSLVGPTYVWATMVIGAKGLALDEVSASEVKEATIHNFQINPLPDVIHVRDDILPWFWGDVTNSGPEYPAPLLGYLREDKFFFASDYNEGEGTHELSFYAGSKSTSSGYLIRTTDGYDFDGPTYFWLTSANSTVGARTNR